MSHPIMPAPLQACVLESAAVQTPCNARPAGRWACGVRWCTRTAWCWRACGPAAASPRTCCPRCWPRSAPPALPSLRSGPVLLTHCVACNFLAILPTNTPDPHLRRSLDIHARFCEITVSGAKTVCGSGCAVQQQPPVPPCHCPVSAMPIGSCAVGQQAEPRRPADCRSVARPHRQVQVGRPAERDCSQCHRAMRLQFASVGFTSRLVAGGRVRPAGDPQRRRQEGATAAGGQPTPEAELQDCDSTALAPAQWLS